MFKILQCFQRAREPIHETCHFLAAPAEIRLAIYARLAPCSFLPYVHYKKYLGLFLSCKQIRNEMEGEALRLAPDILQALQRCDANSIMNLRPLRPLDFGSLMHVTISIPRWALFSLRVQENIFSAMAPLLQLHLSSLTIGLEDLQDEADAMLAMASLDTVQQSNYLAAFDHIRFDWTGNVTYTSRYDTRTTYADIIEFATRINCLVEPNLCAGNHDNSNHWCLATHFPHPPPSNPCNIRRIVFCLRKLHPEALCSCGCGHLPHHIYPSDAISFRWSPVNEARQLRKNKWWVGWADMKGKVHQQCPRKDPAVIVWRKLEKGSIVGLLGKLKALLKQLKEGTW
tara:strand:+ start:25170 stop:26195 length:1026 start_codon:yes stop_codon:yes gene_type:complete